MCRGEHRTDVLEPGPPADLEQLGRSALGETLTFEQFRRRLTSGASQQEITSRFGWYIVAVLMLVAVVNQMDRQIVSVLLVPIQKELGATDTEMGLASGSAFGIFYVLASVRRFRMVARPGFRPRRLRGRVRLRICCRSSR
jgi:hypothetical protein